VTSRKVDLEKLRVALQRMNRDNLLLIAVRAIEIVPRTKLQALVGDRVRLEDLVEGKRGAGPLLDEVRKFHAAGLAGEYYQSFNSAGEEFAREVDRTIADFADYERPKHLAAARRVANSEQKAALRQVPGRERRR